MCCDATDFECFLVQPTGLEQVNNEASLGYSTLQNIDTQKDAAESHNAQNPYTLKAWKGENRYS